MLPIRIAAAAALALLCHDATAGEPPAPVAVESAPLGGSPFAGHFRLAAPDGGIVDSDALSGKPYGLFFGFTHCPDICPTTLAALSTALSRLPASASDLRIYFVTVDPERDTPEALARFMANFDPRIVALSGERPDIDEAIGSFGAVARRSDLAGGGYVYGHTAAILLVDENGLIVDRVGTEADPDRLTARLAALAGSPRADAAPPSR